MVKGKESRLLFRRLKLRLDRTTNFAIVWNETKPPPFDLRAYLRFELLDLCRILLVLNEETNETTYRFDDVCCEPRSLSPIHNHIPLQP